jgi:hypothetical protein
MNYVLCLKLFGSLAPGKSSDFLPIPNCLSNSVAISHSGVFTPFLYVYPTALKKILRHFLPKPCLLTEHGF